jgi:hypothetical protein
MQVKNTAQIQICKWMLLEAITEKRKAEYNCNIYYLLYIVAIEVIQCWLLAEVIIQSVTMSGLPIDRGWAFVVVFGE